MGYWTDTKRAEAIAGIRRVCDFLEANPEFTMPSSFSGPLYVQNWGEADDANMEAVRAWFLKNAAILGPDAKPVQDDSQFILMRDFGGVSLCLMTHRVSLCRKRVEKVTLEQTAEVVILECADEIKALGFDDPGEVKPDSWERTLSRGYPIS